MTDWSIILAGSLVGLGVVVFLTLPCLLRRLYWVEAHHDTRCRRLNATTTTDNGRASIAARHQRNSQTAFLHAQRGGGIKIPRGDRSEHRAGKKRGPRGK